MEILLAKVFGLYFLAVGIGFLFTPNRFVRLYKQMVLDEAVLLLGGVMAFFIGAWVVSVHNVWVMDWPVILTVVGWISLIKGVGIMVYPNFSSLFSAFFEGSSAVYRVFGVLWVVIGGFLLYQGFWVG